MPSNHLILCHSLLLLPSIFPSIRFFSNESALCIRWPKYWSFSFNISPSNEHPGLISFRKDWLDLFAVQGTLKSLLQHHSSKHLLAYHSLAFLLRATPPDLEPGIASLGSPAPVQPLLLGRGVAPPGRRPWPRAGVAPLGYSCAVAAWHSRPPHLTSDTGNSSQPPPLGHGVLSASAPDRGRGVALGCALPAPCAPSQPPARCRSPLRAVAAEICDLQ